MALKIIHGTELIPVEHPVFLIVGDPGICKTSLGYSMPESLLLDFDMGAHRAVNRRDTVQIERWSEFEELLSGDYLNAYRSIVLDTVGRVLDSITADIAENDPKKAPGGNLSQQGFGVLKTRFKNTLTRLRAKGKDVLLLAHAKEERDGDTRIIRADIIGGSLAEVLKLADFVGYLTMTGMDRTLDFSPSDRCMGKNPASWRPFMVPEPAKATAFMADLYDRGRKALGAISGESAKVLAQVEDWRTKLTALTTADACTGVIEELNALPPILQPQVKKILMDHAKGLGLTFDRGAKGFVVAAPPETASVSNVGLHGLKLTPENIATAAAVTSLVDGPAGETKPADDTKQPAKRARKSDQPADAA